MLHFAIFLRLQILFLYFQFFDLFNLLRTQIFFCFFQVSAGSFIFLSGGWAHNALTFLNLLNLSSYRFAQIQNALHLILSCISRFLVICHCGINLPYLILPQPYLLNNIFLFLLKSLIIFNFGHFFSLVELPVLCVSLLFLKTTLL